MKENIVSCKDMNDNLVNTISFNKLDGSLELIVYEGQEVAVLKNGIFDQLYLPGLYKLFYDNYNSITSVDFYFFNMLYSSQMFWGTNTPIIIKKADLGDKSIELGVRGQMVINIINSKELLLKLIGTNRNLTKNRLEQFIQGVFISIVREVITHEIYNNNLSVDGINAHLSKLSAMMNDKIKLLIENYGLSISNFNIEEITLL